MTLVELMVVMILAGVVIAAASSALIQSQRAVAGTLQRQADLGEARIAADAVSADLRTMTELGGVYLQTATAREVQFFARRDVPPGDGPVRIRIRREDNGDLVRYSTRPPTGAGTAPSPAAYDTAGLTTQRRVLASGVRTDVAVFRYFSSYTLVAVTPSPSVSPTGSELPLVAPGGGGDPAVASASRPNVQFIEIRLAVQQAGSRDVGVTPIRQLVRLSNM